MKNFYKISTIVLILLLLFGGYYYYKINQSEKLFLEYAKTEITGSLYKLSNGLNLFTEKETTNLSYHQFGTIYEEIGISASAARALSSNPVLSDEERSTLNELERVLTNLKYFLEQISAYQEIKEPFQLGACEKVYFKSEQDVLKEIDSFREILNYTDSTKYEERWEDLLKNFNGTGKWLCENWESPLLR